MKVGKKALPNVAQVEILAPSVWRGVDLCIWAKDFTIDDICQAQWLFFIFFYTVKYNQAFQCLAFNAYFLLLLLLCSHFQRMSDSRKEKAYKHYAWGERCSLGLYQEKFGIGREWSWVHDWYNQPCQRARQAVVFFTMGYTITGQQLMSGILGNTFLAKKKEKNGSERNLNVGNFHISVLKNQSLCATLSVQCCFHSLCIVNM